MSLLAQSSFFCPQVNVFSETFSYKQKVSLSGSSEKIYLRNRNNWKLGVSFGGYPYFPAPHHPLELELQAEMMNEGDGIGIDKFFQGKNIFVAGVLGVVGKALVEKLLRSTSAGKIYFLFKATDKETAFDKLSKEIIQSELWGCIREKYGDSYKEFVQEKLIPVVGNICEPNLGMDIKSAHTIMDEVDVIIESAASNTLNDTYDALLETNLIAPQRLMRFAKSCRNLKLFVHISSAYVNGRKEGLIPERPLIMGENGRKDDNEIYSSQFPQLDISHEINLAMKSYKNSADCDATRDLKRLGLERATFHGWHNAYHMTKAMAEMVLDEIRGETRVLIIRPSIIEGAYQEPLPGWIQENGMCDRVIISYGKGQLPALFADQDAHVDIVPVDMVANTTIAAIAKHGQINKSESIVYHASTDFVNPLTYKDFFQYIYEHFKENPLTNSKCIKPIRLFNEFSDFSKYTRDEISGQIGMGNVVGTNGKAYERLKKEYNAKVFHAEQLCKMYEFAGFFKARFSTGNTRKLLEEMSKDERHNFNVDASSIDWKKYFVEIHIPGLRKHVLNDARASS